MRKLPYFKPFLTFEEQASLLEERGLPVTADEDRKFPDSEICKLQDT